MNVPVSFSERLDYFRLDYGPQHHGRPVVEQVHGATPIVERIVTGHMQIIPLLIPGVERLQIVAIRLASTAALPNQLWQGDLTLWRLADGTA
jgi:hypothetical protein